MSTEKAGDKFSKEGTRTSPLERSGEQDSKSQPTISQQQKENERGAKALQSTPKFRSSQPQNIIKTSPTDATTASSSVSSEGSSPRQVIAVSASKGPAAFFNLARKFLATDEMCDLSALEGAIVSAVDAAHLLERSQLAHIVRVTTSYVTVEPKGRKSLNQAKPEDEDAAAIHEKPESFPPLPKIGPTEATSISDKTSESQAILRETTEAQLSISRSQRGRPPNPPSGRELRRARIVITVRRTESYTRWLQENPLQAIISNDGNVDEALEKAPGKHAEPK